jgi:phage baseplate assembly protein W
MTAISLPFRIDGYGRVTSTTDPSKIWADRVRSVLMTSFGERIMRPGFGSSMSDEVYDVLDEIPELTYAAVARAFADFLPRLQFNDVVLLSEEEENGIVSLEISYTLPDVVQDPVTQTVSLRIN